MPKKPTTEAPVPVKPNPIDVGTYQRMSTKRLKKNTYNPNRMTEETYASLRYGMEKDGWIGQPLIVLGRDDEGNDRNVIIDGEHRWRVAVELGFKEVPCFVLDGISESKAKSLTIAMNQRRGDFDPAGLQALLASIQDDIPDLALATGIGDKDLALMLNAARTMGEEADAALDAAAIKPDEPAPEKERTRTGKKGVEATPSTLSLAVSFDTQDDRDAFDENVRTLATQYGTTGVNETLCVALQHAADALR